jgi:phosphoribosylformylglycinamidine synthase
MWQFSESVRALADGALEMDLPVTGGNVSFYNQSVVNGIETPVFPTPTIGMIGLVDDKEKIMTLDFKQKGDLIFLIGESKNDIASSEYLYNLRGIKNSPAPYFDLEKEFELQESVKGLIANKLVNAAHDCSDGGLWVTLAEMSMPRGLGFDIESDSEIRLDAFLFGEAQSRVVVTVTEDQEAEFIEFMTMQNTPFTLLGHVTKGKMVIDGEHYGFSHEMKPSYDNSLGEKIMAN